MTEYPNPVLLPAVGDAVETPDGPVVDGLPEETKPSLRPEDAGKVIVLGILLSNVVGIIIRHEFLASVFAMMPMVLLAVYYTRKREVSLAEAFPMAPVSLAFLLGPVPVYLCAKVLEADVIVAIDYLAGGKLSGWGEMFPSAGGGLLFTQMLIAAAVVAPIAEELVFRGFCHKCFVGWNAGWAAVFPSIIFASFHHPLGMPGAFLGGVLFSIFSTREYSLLAGILVHAVSNGCLTVFGRMMAGSSPSQFLAVMIVIHVLLLIVLVVQRRYVKGLWLEFRSLWRQFASRPQFGVRMRTVFKHWSYKIILLMMLLTAAAMVAIPYLERHLGPAGAI